MTVIKEHWLHGKIEFNVDVTQEDNCLYCIHWQVCKKKMSDFCLNYTFGTNEARQHCDGCLHRHTRFTEDVYHGKPNRIPCFKCRWFRKMNESVPKKETINPHPCEGCCRKQTRNTPPYDRVCFCWELNRYINSIQEGTIKVTVPEVKEKTTRFKCKICGNTVNRATNHLRKKHHEIWGKMDFVDDWFIRLGDN